MNPTQELDQKPQKRSLEPAREAKQYPDEQKVVMTMVGSPRLETPKQKVSSLEYFGKLSPNYQEGSGSVMNQQLVQQRLEKFNFSQANSVDCDFTGCSFKNSSFERVTFTKCNFTDCSFQGIQLRSLTFVSCSFTNCQFTNIFGFEEASPNIDFTQCELKNSSITGLDIELILVECHLEELDLGNSTFAKLLPTKSSGRIKCSGIAVQLMMLVEGENLHFDWTEIRYLETCCITSGNFQHITFEELEAKSLMLSDLQLYNCQIKNCLAETLVISDSDLQNSSIQNLEGQSITLVDTIMNECNLAFLETDNLTILRNDWKKTNLVKTSTSMQLTQSSFIESHIQSCSFKSSVLESNKFVNCKIENNNFFTSVRQNNIEDKVSWSGTNEKTGFLPTWPPNRIEAQIFSGHLLKKRYLNSKNQKSS